MTKSSAALKIPPTATPEQPEKFVVPGDWRVKFDASRIGPQNKQDYCPIQIDLAKCLTELTSIDFILFFLVGWDLFEVARPGQVDPESIKEIVDIHKKWPSQTRIVVKRLDHGRYERLASNYRKKRFESASAGIAMALMPVFTCYNELANASQLVVRGALHAEVYGRCAGAVSFTVAKMPSTRDILRFLTLNIGKDPVLYDHGAITSMLAIAITWNSLKLKKRETKLAGQAAMLHDVERNCSYLFKPANTTQISVNSIKEIAALRDQGIGFHECIGQTMQQYREKYGGGGYPNGLRGSIEEMGDTGISRIARVTSIACGFSEYLLKRQDKQPLTLEMIENLLRQRAGSDFDPAMVEAFLQDAKTGTVRKLDAKLEVNDDSDEDF